MTLTAEQRSRLHRVAQAVVQGQDDDGVSLLSLKDILDTNKLEIIQFLQERALNRSDYTCVIQEADSDLFRSRFGGPAIYLVSYPNSGHNPPAGVVTELADNMKLFAIAALNTNGFQYEMERADKDLVENRRRSKANAQAAAEETSQPASTTPAQPDPSDTVNILTQAQLLRLADLSRSIADRQADPNLPLLELKTAFDDEISKDAILNYLRTWVQRLGLGRSYLFKADPSVFRDTLDGTWMYLGLSGFAQQVNTDEFGAITWPGTDVVLIAISPTGGYKFDLPRASYEKVLARRASAGKETRIVSREGVHTYPANSPATSSDSPDDENAEAKQDLVNWLHEALKAHVALRGDKLAELGLQTVIGDEVTLDKLLKAAKLLGIPLQDMVTIYVLEKHRPGPERFKPIFGKGFLTRDMPDIPGLYTGR